jgi:hypothetical protein
MSNERLVWIADGKRTYLKLVPFYALNADGTTQINNVTVRWVPFAQ